ncbi:hypothetical protein O7635_00880 [Asanoa sp. WMMD1127]|uniref:hypothetical protein n=1 Tax=Asanoa sp. WMMD1127 TaxID=3016107 RepID=UPI002416A891|nr:hypothetical protein [Asanoa sp. WMMD1127]MDG4820405.1 hypothetical protein [Asanoa sp. WMMD1127]
MLVPHRTPEHWHLPTPFSTADGGPISLRLPRPNLYWLVFVVGWINVAEAALTALEMQHHTLVRIAAHSVSVVLATISTWGVNRVADPGRFARSGTIIAALPALYLPAHPGPLLEPTLFVGGAILLTAAGEIGYRLSKECGCGARS